MKGRSADDETREDLTESGRELSVNSSYNIPRCNGRKIEKLLGGGGRRAQHHCHKISDTNGTYSGTNFLQMYERGN